MDRAYLLAGHDSTETRLPEGARGLPSWASSEAKNLRGVVSVQSSHYLGLVELNGRVVEVILDSGGARTMVDRETAIALGLKIEWADDQKFFGSFSGVSSTPTRYAGRAVGPISIKFSEEVEFLLGEFKIFEYPEPIILIGTDLLGHAAKGPFTFAYLGVNPTTTAGEIIFYGRRSNIMVVCELVHAPTSHTNRHVLPDPNKKNVTFLTQRNS